MNGDMQVATHDLPYRPGTLPDYYAILGVLESATFVEIQAAYWRQTRLATAHLSLLNEAYEVLGNAQRRQAYDSLRRSRSDRPKTQPHQPARRGSPELRQRLQWYLR